MKFFYSFLISILFFSSSNACIFDGDENNAGTLTPTTAYQTQINVTNGNYYTINVTCGNTYNFNFCNNGGASSWDTQITILETNGTTQLAYNDDACSLNSDVTWTSDFTGTVYVLISKYTCDNTGSDSGSTLAYNEVVGGPFDTSFSMSVTCGGGTSSITGTPGGIFSFNPVPGDGAQVDATTGTVTNGTVGTTYSIEYALCGTSSTETVTVLDDDCWTLNGDAQYINVSGDNCIELTAAANGQTGCSWNSNQLDFNSDFSLTLDYYFGANINGADGSTFTFHPGASTSCGTNGNQIGAGGIANSLVIEFDTYDNDNSSTVNDLACDHIAIETDGNLFNGAPAAGPVCAKSGGGNIDDGTTYEVEIAWNATTHVLDVYFDGALRLSYTNDIVTNVFGGQNMVYWGATASTGGLNNQQYFCPSTLVILPTEIGELYATCNTNEEKIYWTTLSESRVSHFELEYTYDNLVFFPIESVNAVGNSQTVQNYSITYKNNDKTQRYYRLKSVDENGEYEYTGIVASQQCGNNDLIQTIYNGEDKLTIITKNEAKIQMTNQLGQVIFEQSTDNQFVTIPTSSLNSGIYFILAEDQKGERLVRKIYVK